MFIKLNKQIIKTTFRHFQTKSASSTGIISIGKNNMECFKNNNNSFVVGKALNNYVFEQKRFVMHDPLTKRIVEDRIMLVLNLFDKIDNDKLTLDSDFFKDLGLDSLDFVEVIIALEDEFDFEIPDGDSDRMKTPRDIYKYICEKNDIY
uniref:Acyl carrier protein n=1 Tax=Meloidogyne incognita TaxID=6306 RepID=A0A914M2T5_MELIC